MKFVFLNRELLNVSLVADLRKSGHAVFVCSDVREAEIVLKLHGKTVTLVLAHDQSGLELISLMKASHRFMEVPVVLSHSTWKESEFQKHQKGVEAANGYVAFPCGDVELLRIFDQVLKTNLVGSGTAKALSSVAMIPPDTGGLQISDGPISFEADAPMKSTVGEGESVLSFDMGGEGLAIALEAEPASLAVPGPASRRMDTGPKREPDLSDAPATSIAISTTTSALVAELASDPFSAQENAGDFKLADPLDEHTGQRASDIIPESLIAPIPSTAPPPTLMDPESLPPLGEPTTFGQMAETVFALPPATPAPSLEDFAEEATMAKTIVQMAQPARTIEPTRVSTQTATEVDADALAQMPYLQNVGRISPLAYTPHLDNALVPGGAAQAPDVETLKRYLLLREQDVMALSAQLKQAKDQVANLDQQLRQERATNTEFAHLVQEQGRRIEDFDKEKEIALESAQKEVDDLRFELKRRTDRMKLIEYQVKEAQLETERLKERVRLDIRKIRAREKELENRLEIMKKDSEALLGGREQKILELKRKLDLAEFNMDLLQDQLEKEKTHTQQLRAKLERAAQVVRVAGGLLHPNEAGDGEIFPDEDAQDPAA